MNNKELIDATKKFSEDCLKKSTKTVNTLTHPTPKVNKIGSTIGSGVGVGLILGGTTVLLLGKGMLGLGSMAAGAVTIISNTINHKH
jgi:hypothetical protein